MKNTSTALVAAAMAALGLAAGHWWATRTQPAQEPATAATAATASSAPQAGAAKPRRLLYYRNPMGLPDTSPTPKKDPMGMDYVPVYEGEDDAPAAGSNAVRISVEKVQKLGVRTERAAMRTLGRDVRAAGRIEPDERRVVAIAPKFEGYVERLHVNATGQPVAKGQPLFEAYSPELLAAQREYAIAMQGARELPGDAAAGMRRLAEAGLARLRNWDIPPDQLDAIASGPARRTLTVRSPVAGVVTEKKALQGQRFMPGDTLFQVTDLSAVWVVADVFEQDLGLVRPGAKATVTLDAYPGKTFTGTIGYVYPTLKPETRTVPVRIELPNPGGLLKPGLFAQVALQAGDPAPVLTVPASAVIDSGTRRIVLVQAGEGRFEPRPVQLGARSEAYAQVLSGVREGELVVVAANFLIDAESNLQAAIGGMAAPAAASAAASSASPARPSVVGHRAQGTVDEIDRQAGTVSLSHGPVPSLKWPAMTMEFKVANAALLQGLKPGAVVAFEFVERQPGDWVITSLAPAAPSHAGH